MAPRGLAAAVNDETFVIGQEYVFKFASASAVANFLWLPYQPWWSVIVIAIDVFVIWAVTAHGRDITRV